MSLIASGFACALIMPHSWANAKCASGKNSYRAHFMPKPATLQLSKERPGIGPPMIKVCKRAAAPSIAHKTRVRASARRKRATAVSRLLAYEYFAFAPNKFRIFRR